MATTDPTFYRTPGAASWSELMDDGDPSAIAPGAMVKKPPGMPSPKVCSTSLAQPFC